MTEILKPLNSYADLLTLSLTIALFVIGYLLQRKGHRISSLLAWNSYRDAIRTYAERVIDVLSDLAGLCEANPEILKQEFWDRWSQLLSRVSSLRDSGKLLIPNLDPHSFGQHKAKAYQGIRDKALDCLAGAFWMAAAIDYSRPANNSVPTSLAVIPPDGHQLQKLKVGLDRLPTQVDAEGPREPDYDQAPGTAGKQGWSCKRALIEAKRQFVSQVQELVDPHRWTKEIAKLIPRG